MSVECIIRVDSERVSIEIAQSHYSFQAPNLVGWDPTTQKILALGTEAELRRQLGAKRNSLNDRIEFTPAFSSNHTDPDLDVAVLMYYLCSTTRGSSMLRQMFQFTFSRFDYVLTIPEYGHFSEERKERLQYLLQTRLGAHKISINGRSVEIPVWKRSFEAVVSFFLTQVGPLLGLWYLILFAPHDRIVLFLFALAAFFLFGTIAGSAIWMVTMQILVPKSYLRYRAQGLNRIGVRRLSNWLLA